MVDTLDGNVDFATYPTTGASGNGSTTFGITRYRAPVDAMLPVLARVRGVVEIVGDQELAVD